jgi:hypothetical protein
VPGGAPSAQRRGRRQAQVPGQESLRIVAQVVLKRSTRSLPLLPQTDLRGSVHKTHRGLWGPPRESLGRNFDAFQRGPLRGVSSPEPPSICTPTGRSHRDWAVTRQQLPPAPRRGAHCPGAENAATPARWAEPAAEDDHPES